MLTQTLQSMRVVKAYGQEKHEAERISGIVDKIRKSIVKTSRSKALVGPIWEAMSGLGIGAVILYAGWQGIYGNVTIGHFLGFMAAALLAMPHLKALATIQAGLAEGLLATERVFDLIDYRSRIVDRPGVAPLRVKSGAITFRHVEFAYEPGYPVLSGFDLEVAPGQKVALVGESGAGKRYRIQSRPSLLRPRSWRRVD